MLDSNSFENADHSRTVPFPLAQSSHEPRSAYVHIPFCRHRCGYCNFTLVTGRDDLIEPFLTALQLELQAVLDQPQSIDTLFIGGGTPSYLSASDLARLLKLLRSWFRLDSHGEFSCELNPSDCRPGHLQVLRDYGVTRVSLGGQSFSPRKLRMLERDHTAEELHAACLACSQFFENVALDLIFAVPDESLTEWQADIQAALNSPVQHLSTYGLTIERGAAFYGRTLRGRLREVDDELQLALYEYAIDKMTLHGWQHYEVSNFARPGFRCRHNENYWLGNCWWGFGPGAASFLANRAGRLFRNVNHRSTTSYIRRLQSGDSPVAEREEVAPEQVLRERLVFGLRRLEGVNLEQLKVSWGSPVRELFEPYLTEYIQQGWLALDPAQQLRLTRRGLMISDSLWPNLLV